MGVSYQFLIDRALKQNLGFNLPKPGSAQGWLLFIDRATFTGLATSIHFDRNDFRQGSLWKLQNRSCCDRNKVSQAA